MARMCRRIAALVLAGACCVAAPVAGAQETGITGDIERYATTNPQEKIDYAVEANAEIRESIKAISKMVEVARRENNLERQQCLNKRLVAIRSLLQVSEAAEIAMREALTAGTMELADFEFRKIAVARSKTRTLHAEADKCLEDSGARPGEYEIDVEGGDSTDTDDLAKQTFEGDIDYDPPDTSPFM